MRFDPHSGFDAEAMAAITEPLPRADANLAVLRDVAEALRFYLKPKHGNPIRKERDRLRRELRLLDRLDANLRKKHIVDFNSGRTARELQVVLKWKRDNEDTIKFYDWILRTSKGHDVARELFYRQLLLIWREAGGELRSSETTTGGPLARFTTAIMICIGKKPPTIPGLREIVRRERGKRRAGVGVLAKH